MDPYSEGSRPFTAPAQKPIEECTLSRINFRGRRPFGCRRDYLALEIAEGVQQVKLLVGMTACIAMLSTGTAFAAGKSDCAPGQNKAALAAFYAGTGSPTPGGVVSNLGGAISGG